MVGKPNPRPRIREVALHMYAQGTTPTPKLVRDALGGGSPNIIVEVLADLRNERQMAESGKTGIPPKQKQVADALQSIGLHEATALIAEAAATANAMREAASGIPALLSTIERLLGEAAAMRTALDKAVSDAVASRAWFESEVAKVEARYSGVQKHMLLQIEDARASTGRLREELRQSQDDKGLRDNQHKMIINDLRNENARLQGVIDELRGQLARTQA
ncbi:DNA-binding protein [Burkholderia cenocepacia]|uniref:DNA-binding protein n=1 Tax=Burkholderia cenocepacia TaxID=95486 RepID=UPI00076D856A|nr:DNA-binding protein [Burkholderia cenocepacia]KWU17806.1 hypothetical protein AS149_13885 [Burkholderia cenocepacia]